MNSKKDLVRLEDIIAARKIIQDHVHHTPVIRSSYLGQQAGVQLYLKLESFQKTGSFKPRGVLNKLHHLSPKQRSKGLITYSAGNLAQALAWAASHQGIKSTIVMSAKSAKSKIEATRSYGGEIIFAEENAWQICQRIQKEREFTLVHPFDDPILIAGHGTLGLEILEDVPDLDAVIVGIGGGGLISGIATAIKTIKPNVQVIGTEPEGAAAMHESLIHGRPITLDKIHTVADGLAAPFTGDHTLAHVQAYVDQVVLVSDDEILEAMRLLLERCKVLVEPAGSASVAALLHGKVPIPRGSNVVCILSGGNIDLSRLKELL